MQEGRHASKAELSQGAATSLNARVAMNGCCCKRCCAISVQYCCKFQSTPISVPEIEPGGITTATGGQESSSLGVPVISILVVARVVIAVLVVTLTVVAVLVIAVLVIPRTIKAVI